MFIRQYFKFDSICNEDFFLYKCEKYLFEPLFFYHEICKLEESISVIKFVVEPPHAL